MKTIHVSEILKLKNISEYKFHAARWNNSEQPLDVFVRSKKEWFGWNTWRNNKDEFSRNYIFSLIDFYPEENTWLFGGIYKILERNNISKAHSYKILELEEYSQYVGRLKINLEKPSRGRAFYLENYYDQMIVSEILKESYSGEIFPGFDNISHDFTTLENIFNNEKIDWKSALENIKGVYLITDKNNGKKYVGSAYGDYGIWTRWKCYMKTGHGWNDELTELIKKEGFKYAQENFKITLLEYMKMQTDDKYIIKRESFWKEAFLSRGKFGYNKN